MFLFLGKRKVHLHRLQVSNITYHTWRLATLHLDIPIQDIQCTGTCLSRPRPTTHHTICKWLDSHHRKISHETPTPKHWTFCSSMRVSTTTTTRFTNLAKDIVSWRVQQAIQKYQFLPLQRWRDNQLRLLTQILRQAIFLDPTIHHRKAWTWRLMKNPKDLTWKIQHLAAMEAGRSVLRHRGEMSLCQLFYDQHIKHSFVCFRHVHTHLHTHQLAGIGYHPYPYVNRELSTRQ